MKPQPVATALPINILRQCRPGSLGSGLECGSRHSCSCPPAGLTGVCGRAVHVRLFGLLIAGHCPSPSHPCRYAAHSTRVQFGQYKRITGEHDPALTGKG